MQIRQWRRFEKSGRLRNCVFRFFLLDVVRRIVRCGSRAVVTHKFSVIFFIVRLVPIRWQSQRDPRRIFDARLNVFLYGHQGREMVLTGAYIINVDTFIVSTVILEFLLDFDLKAHSIFHSMLRLPMLTDLFQAFVWWILWQRESCIRWIDHWPLHVHILFSLVVDPLYFDIDIVNVYSFLLEIGCHELSVL